jgi:hypothetical protein
MHIYKILNLKALGIFKWRIGSWNSLERNTLRTPIASKASNDYHHDSDDRQRHTVKSHPSSSAFTLSTAQI